MIVIIKVQNGISLENRDPLLTLCWQKVKINKWESSGRLKGAKAEVLDRMSCVLVNGGWPTVFLWGKYTTVRPVVYWPSVLFSWISKYHPSKCGVLNRNFKIKLAVFIILKKENHPLLCFCRPVQFGARRWWPMWTFLAWLRVRTTVLWLISLSQPSPWQLQQNLPLSVLKLSTV